MNQNPFQRLGIEAVPYARRRKIEKETAKALANTPEEKAKVEKAKLWNQYLDELDKRHKALVSGPYAETAEALLAFLKKMTLYDGEELIQMAYAWQSAPRTTRFLVLQTISQALINLRVRNDLSPFDDPIEPDDTNCFMTIRNLLNADAHP